MEPIYAIYENGVFRPTVPVDLPEHAQVVFEPRLVERQSTPSLAEIAKIHEILARSYETGETDLAARHNEHQP